MLRLWNVVLAHMYADRGACVSSCGEGRMNVDGICQDCDGPCPRSTLLYVALLVFGLRLGLDLGLAGQDLASALADIVKLVNYSTLTATFNC